MLGPVFPEFSLMARVLLDGPCALFGVYAGTHLLNRLKDSSARETPGGVGL